VCERERERRREGERCRPRHIRIEKHVILAKVRSALLDTDLVDRSSRKSMTSIFMLLTKHLSRSWVYQQL
jgi:hypothetical protein